MLGKSAHFGTRIDTPIPFVGRRWGVTVPGLPLEHQVTLRWAVRGAFALVSFGTFGWQSLVIWGYFGLMCALASLIIGVPLLLIDGLIWLASHQAFYLESISGIQLPITIFIIMVGLLALGKKIGKRV